MTEGPSTETETPGTETPGTESPATEPPATNAPATDEPSFDDAAVPGNEGPTDAPWQRLSARMIWVDVVQSALSLAPGAIAIWAVGIDPTPGTLWPLGIIAALGVFGAVTDALRWVFTRYRVTESEVQRRTGVVVRRYRAVRRERIRSVDTHAKLRHRLSGLRVVTIGAGQQVTSGESAFLLDAVTKNDAGQLQRTLLRERGTAREPDAQTSGPDSETAGHDGTNDSPNAPEKTTPVEVFARLRPWWVIYNMFSIWAYLSAAGLIWAAYWLATTFGIDLLAWVTGLADWEEMGWPQTIAIGLVGVGALGAIGMAANFVTSQWRFELARVHHPDGRMLRTRRGLFSTREVNRDESRMRGLSIGEPLLWRWMGMADTNVITTGLGIWSGEQPTSILPRGPISVARRVAAAVFETDRSPLEAPLPRHPRAALRRRAWWATLGTLSVVASVVWPATTGVVPGWVVWAAAGVWPITLLGALVAYQALGHLITEDHVITRSGLMSRSTSALRRDAVSTIALRQSVLQRRLGLTTVSAMTAAGWGIYEAPDVDADEAVEFAAAAAPGLLDPFLRPTAPSE